RGARPRSAGDADDPPHRARRGRAARAARARHPAAGGRVHAHGRRQALRAARPRARALLRALAPVRIHAAPGGNALRQVPESNWTTHVVRGLGASTRHNALAYGYSLATTGAFDVLAASTGSYHPLEIFLFAIGGAVTFTIATASTTTSS